MMDRRDQAASILRAMGDHHVSTSLFLLVLTLPENTEAALQRLRTGLAEATTGGVVEFYHGVFVVLSDDTMPCMASIAVLAIAAAPNLTMPETSVLNAPRKPCGRFFAPLAGFGSGSGLGGLQLRAGWHNFHAGGRCHWPEGQRA